MAKRASKKDVEKARRKAGEGTPPRPKRRPLKLIKPKSVTDPSLPTKKKSPPRKKKRPARVGGVDRRRGAPDKGEIT